MESISRPAADNNNDEHHHQVLVQFPSLDDNDPQQNHNNPPTDSSEEGTVEEGAAASSSSAASSSTSSGVGHEEGVSQSSSASSEESSVDATAAATQRQAATADDGCSVNNNDNKRKKLSTSSASTTTASSSFAATATTSSPCEERRKQLPPIPDLVDESDPASIIKTYLNDLVALLREAEGENGHKTHKRRKVELQPRQEDDGGVEEKKQPASATATMTASTKGLTNSKPSSTSSSSQEEEEEKEKSSKEPIDTIMHWMDSFQDDETIQLMCLQSLPTILEDPTLRRIAQSDGLASIVLYDMAAFPSNSLLILTAFHTLVVLLRPLGTNEGMVHKANSVTMSQRSTMSSTSSKGIPSISKHHGGGVGGSGASAPSSSTTEATAAIHSVNFKGSSSSPPSSSSTPQQHSKQQRSNSTSSSSSSSSVISNTQLYDPSMKNQLTNWEENGVRVMLDSLRRFSNDRYLQAMGCWAMVNAALYPSLKSSLTRLGGVYAVTNAMMLHPNAEAVQFRALFALINLVIPERDNNNERSNSSSSIHSHVYQIARLTILAMKNFHTNKSILNRGCLVLRNLSLTPSFVKILGRTPGCVDMLLHCRQICPRDVLVQRSARTIMVMIQRATEKDQQLTTTSNAHDRNSFTLTQPFPVPSRGELGGGNRSSSPASTLSSGVSQRKL